LFFLINFRARRRFIWVLGVGAPQRRYLFFLFIEAHLPREGTGTNPGQSRGVTSAEHPRVNFG
jgi:hypothetical protein